jgi:prepilin-type N-terminal cleavage/methylation domain-containing protein
MSRARDNRGFTLIEMLVALTIVATIMAMLYGSFTATTRSMDASRTHMACVERGSFALRLMARQIRCAYAPAPHSTHSKSRDTALDELPLDIGTGPLIESPSVVFQGNSRDPRGEILSFVSGGGLGIGPGARGLSRVTWHFDRISSTLSVSRRDASGFTPKRSSREAADTVLRDVIDIQLGFYDGQRWEQSWDMRRRHELPRAVRIELTVMDEMGRSHRMGTAVPIIQQISCESGNKRGPFAAGQP